MAYISTGTGKKQITLLKSSELQQQKILNIKAKLANAVL